MSIFKKFSNHLPHYFQKRLSKQLEELYVSVAILDFALAAVALFEPVYLYQLGYSIAHILMFYMVAYVTYFFLLPLGGKVVAQFGPERSIAISTLFFISYYLGLLLIKGAPIFFWITPIIFAIQKTLYWPAYHTDFILTSDQGQRGKEFSGLWSLSTVMNILGPVVGGLMITTAGFTPLFLAVIAVIAVSNIPLFVTPINHQPEKFSYRQSFVMPFSRQHIRTTLAYLGFGEEFVMQFIWPIFVVLVLKSYLEFGGLIALATLVTALATLYIGKMVDEHHQRRALDWGAIGTALVWLTRPFLRFVPGVFASDTFGRIAKNTTFVPVTAITYDRALREKNIIPRAVFYEQGFALAKVVAPAAILVLGMSMSIFTAAFVFAGLISLLYLLL